MKHVVTPNRRINGYTAPETRVLRSSIDSLGLFAVADIPRATVVAAWGGKILTATEIERLPSSFRTNYALSLYPGFYIAEANGEELDASDFVNHSCEPNCRIVNLLIMVSKRRISAGEELTADFDSGRNVGRKTRCNCGSPKCRGTVYF